MCVGRRLARHTVEKIAEFNESDLNVVSSVSDCMIEYLLFSVPTHQVAKLTHKAIIYCHFY